MTVDPTSPTETVATALVVGPGDHFLSGISYYTSLLTAGLAERGPVALFQLRRLCPRVFYPGKARVGRTNGALPPVAVPTFVGLDWFWGRSAVGALRFWREQEPGVVILQWWTATVLHSYLMLAVLARRSGARLVLEFHEMQDVGEATLPMVGWYMRAGMRRLLNQAEAIVVHSAVDAAEIRKLYPQFADRQIDVIPHGPFAHHLGSAPSVVCGIDSVPPVHPRESAQPLRLLIFGVVRPYKGHAELAAAIRMLVGSGVDVHLSVVGEVWQGYREPLIEVAQILPANRLTIIDRYVTDEEVASAFAATDVVVLPYRRSSASGPLQIAMSAGLPVVTTSVGGLVEATADYTGAVLVPPNDPAALADGIRAAMPLMGQAHADPHSWGRSAQRYADLFRRIGIEWCPETDVARTPDSRRLPDVVT